MDGYNNYFVLSLSILTLPSLTYLFESKHLKVLWGHFGKNLTLGVEHCMTEIQLWAMLLSYSHSNFFKDDNILLVKPLVIPSEHYVHC